MFGHGRSTIYGPTPTIPLDERETEPDPLPVDESELGIAAGLIADLLANTAPGVDVDWPLKAVRTEAREWLKKYTAARAVKAKG